MKICLISLDERPANTRYPRLLAEIADIELILPPPDMLSNYRESARSDVLIEWLQLQVADCDTLIVNCEMLGYGGLIASRITNESTAIVVSRLDILRTIKTRNPRLRIFGFSVITRIPNYNSAIEEPDYWGEYGSDLNQLSQALDRMEQGEDLFETINDLNARLPAEIVQDFLNRRLRNHTVNLNILQLASEGIFDLLVISSDDTSPYGLGSSEKRWLQRWCQRLNLDERVLLYPGADEVGSILVARAVNQQHGHAPTFQIDYAVPGGEEITAAFEDSAVKITLERQITAAGATIQDEDADIVLMVNTPRSPTHGWGIPYSVDEQRERIPHLEVAITRLSALLATGRVAAVADVAHANGADVEFVERLHSAGLLNQLLSYGAWNTAGNTIGTTVAQASLAWQDKNAANNQRRFFAHRLIEDWLYMANVRQQASSWLESETGQREPSVDRVSLTAMWIEQRLSEAILPLDLGFRIVPGSLQLPWRRTFEIDFDLEPL